MPSFAADDFFDFIEDFSLFAIDMSDEFFEARVIVFGSEVK